MRQEAVHLLECFVRGDPGVIDQNIQVTKLFVDLLGHTIGIRKIADIRLHGYRLAAQVLDLFDQLLCRRFIGDVVDRDIGAFLGRSQSNGAANATRCPRHQGCPEVS